MAKKTSKKTTKKKKVGRPTKVKEPSVKKETFDQFQQNSVKIEPIREKLQKVPGAKFKTDAVERKVFLVPLSREGLKESQEIAKKKNNMGRSQYFAHMVNCQSCALSFDFKKAYPSGKFDATSKTLCPKCQNNRGGY